MIHYVCDGCGATMLRHELRYTITIDAHAAYDEIEVGLVDLVRSHRDEILALLDQLRRQDPKEVEAQIYKRIRLDLCPSCHRRFIKAPLHFHPHTSLQEEDEVNVDAFLRSLGFGKPRKGTKSGDDEA